MHVFLLTLREVMNNFEARGFRYCCPKKDDDSELRASLKLDFAIHLIS